MKTNNPSDTPETDSECASRKENYDHSADCVEAEFARKLERERDRLQRELEHMRYFGIKPSEPKEIHHHHHYQQQPIPSGPIPPWIVTCKAP